MAIDPHYIPAFSIEDVLLDKDTGAPLTGGLVYFEQDNQRGVLKPVYQITGTSPNYTYTQLPNPMTLSSIGTFEDSLSNPVIPYFFPYDSEFNVEYYYIRVTNSENVEQFTREAQPYISLQDSNEVLSVITNELSNPQFAEVVFDMTNGSYTYNVNAVADNVINIAPDWDLIVSAPSAGTVTLTQLKPTGSLNIVTNPGTLLTISSAGLTKLQLRQRIFGSPNLWGSGFLSASFVAKTYSGTAVALNMYYSQSSGTVVDQLLVSANLPASGAYSSFPGSALIPASNSVGNFPSAYVDIYFDIPLSIQIDLTSIMIAYTGVTSIENISYDQESLPRQIDHLYHYAFPIVPIGTVIDYGGFDVPLHYLACNGAAYNRIQYNQLYQKMTKTEVVTLTTGSAAFTVADGSFYRIGMPIEGIGVSPGVTVANVVGNTITMSAVAILPAGTQTVRFFAAGAGDGSTTFNVYDLRDYVIAGNGGAGLVASASNGIGGKTGAASIALAAANIPAHTHTTTVPVQGVAFGFGYASGTATVSQAFVSNGGQSLASVPLTTPPTAFGLVQPTAFLNKCIRYQ